MQKLAAILLSFISMIIVCTSCGKEKGLILQGELTNVETPYILVSYLNKDSLTLDTITVDQKGKFTYLNNQIDTITAFTLYFNHYNSATVFFADINEKLTVKGDAALSDLIMINGNELNNDLSDFKRDNDDLLRRRGELLAELNSEDESDSTVLRVLTNNEKMARIKSLNHELMQKAETFIKENPTKMSSLVLIHDFFTDSETPQNLSRVLAHIRGNALFSPLASKLKAYSEKINLSAEGVRSPQFTLTDLKDKEVKLSDFKGKFLLLSFVSTYGDESRESIKALRKIYPKLNKDSVAFVSVYIDTDEYPVSYLKTDSIQWTIVTETDSWASEVADAYNIRFVPYNILIAPNGVIKKRNIPSQQVREAITGKRDDTIAAVRNTRSTRNQTQQPPN